MAKIYQHNKIKLFYVYFLAFFISLNLDAENKKSFDYAIEGAKKLFLQSKRVEAIEQLNLAQKLAAKKNEFNLVKEKKRVFFEQYFLSESFQKLQNAKAQYELENYSQCLNILNSVASVDQTQLSILELKCKCALKNKDYDLALKSSKIIYDLDEDNIEAASVYGLSLYKLKKIKELDLFLQNQKIKGLMVKGIESFVLLRAKIYLEEKNNKELINFLMQYFEKFPNHNSVLLLLGKTLFEQFENKWLARKYLLIFLGRCKQMNQKEIESLELIHSCDEVVEWIAKIDKSMTL